MEQKRVDLNGIWEINPRADHNTDDVPVSLLDALNRLEEMVQLLVKGLGQLQILVLAEIGTNLDGRLSALALNTHNLVLNNAGEIFAIAQKLKEKEITTPEELAEIKRVEFDEPLQKKEEEYRTRLEQEIKERKTKKALDELGIVKPTEQERKVITDSRI